MTYKLLQGSNVLKLPENIMFAANPQDQNYVDYLAWVSDGNTPDPEITTVAMLGVMAKGSYDSMIKRRNAEVIAQAQDSTLDPQTRINALLKLITGE